MNNPAPGQIFKQTLQTCRLCRSEWTDWQEFVLDPEVRVQGLQAITSVPDSNLLTFEHCCGSTISVRAPLLRHLLGEAEEECRLPLLFGKDNCEEHCRSVEDLAGCQQPCINERDRRLVLQLLAMKQPCRNK